MSFSQIVTEIVKELDRAEPQIRQFVGECMKQGYGEYQPEQHGGHSGHHGHHGHHRRNHGCRRKSNRSADFQAAFCPVMFCPCPEKNNPGDYQAKLDVKNYASEEINVKTVDNFIVVEGKQDEKEDEFGSISRNFVRRYRIPEEFNIDEASSVLSEEGILSIRVPKMVTQSKERVIPIQKTGKPQQSAQDEPPAYPNASQAAEKPKDDSADFEMVKDNLD